MDSRRAEEGFGPLKAVLHDILTVYAGRKVRRQFPVQNPPLTMEFQETVAVERYIKNLLPRIVALEELFNSPPGEVAEHRRRQELIRYAVNRPLRSFLMSS